MSNRYCTARTNYVRFADEAAYVAAKALIDSTSMQWHPHTTHKLVAMVSGDDDSGGFDFTTDDDKEIWWPDITQHLADGQVLVAIEAGAEKLCYVSGHASAVSKSGDYVKVSLDDIYTLAFEKFGVEPTMAEYSTFDE